MPTIELYPIPWGQEPPAHLRQIYEEAFPPEERRPWTQLFGPERCEHIAQLILSDDGGRGLRRRLGATFITLL